VACFLFAGQIRRRFLSEWAAPDRIAVDGVQAERSAARLTRPSGLIRRSAYLATSSRRLPWRSCWRKSLMRWRPNHRNRVGHQASKFIKRTTKFIKRMDYPAA